MNAETTLNYLMVILAFLVLCVLLASAAGFWMIYRENKAKRELNRRLHERAQKDLGQ